MSDATRKKTTPRYALELALAGAGGWFAISSLMAITGSTASENILTRPVVGLIAWLGPWPCLLISTGVAVSGAASFLAPKPLEVAAHALGSLGLGLGFSVLLGALSESAGGILGQTLGTALPGVTGTVLGILLGASVIAATAWLAWFPSWTGFYVKPRELGPVRAVGKQEKSEGVSPAEAEALMAETGQGSKEASAPYASTTVADPRIHGGIPEGARPLQSSDEPSESKDQGEVDPAGGGTSAAVVAARESAGTDLASPREEARGDRDGKAAERSDSAEPADSVPLGDDHDASADVAHAPGSAASPPDASPHASKGVWPLDLDSRALPVRPTWERGASQPLVVSAEEAAPTPGTLPSNGSGASGRGGSEVDSAPREPSVSAGSPKAAEATEPPLAGTGVDPGSPSWEQSDLFDPGEGVKPSAATQASTPEEEHEDEEAETTALPRLEAEEEYDEEETEEEPLAELADEDEDADEEEEQQQEGDEEAEEYEYVYEEADEAPELEEVGAELSEEEEEEEEEASAEGGAEEEPRGATLAAAERVAPSSRGQATAGEGAEAGSAEVEVVEPAAEREYVMTPAATGAAEGAGAGGDPGFERLVFEAGCLILEENRVAVSMLQRKFGMDFKEATCVLDELQARGLIGPYLGGRSRDILKTREEWMASAPSV